MKSHPLTNFEVAKLCGIRSFQFSAGAEPLIPIEGETDDSKITQKELLAGANPLIVRRMLPSGEGVDIQLTKDKTNPAFHKPLVLSANQTFGQVPIDQLFSQFLQGKF